MRKVLLVLSLMLTLMALIVGALVPLTAQEAAPGKLVSSGGVSLTVYNQGTALVQDRRTFELQQGLNLVNFTDVAAGIDATSVSFKSLTDPTGTVVLEQNYVYDLVNSDALLKRYLDQTVEITTYTADGVEVLRGQLLSGRGGEIILRQENGQVIVIGRGSIRDIRFPELPGGLITRPTLRWLVQSVQSGQQEVELTYLTGGMNWSADYILLLATDNQSLDVNGWVTLTNTSGATYTDAQLKLVAGDVNRLPEPQVMKQTAAPLPTATLVFTDGGVVQREFFEYQLYEVERPVTVADNETKQVEFVTGADVPAATFYVYDSSPTFYGYYYPYTDQYYGQTGITDVQNWLEFSTGEENGLGADLPAGRVRVYQEDVDGAALLIGENRINHTPEGEKVRLYLGSAFDLVGERRQTSYSLTVVGLLPQNNLLAESYEIRLRSRKENEAVEIRVPERMIRWSGWQITAASQDYTQLDASTVEFRVVVPPGEERVITYTVEYRWPV